MAMFDNAAVMSLSVDLIDPNPKGRIGFYHPLKAEALSALIVSDGQNDPIKVKAIKRGKYEWELQAGWHRLEACRLAGIEVKALEVIEGDGATYAEIQASENMHRRALGPIERACFVHALAEAAQARVGLAHGGKSQQQIAIAARWNKVYYAAPERSKELDADTAAKITAVYGWQDHVCAAIGMSERSVRNDLALYRAVVAPNRSLVRDLEQRDNPLPASEIAKLIKVVEGQRPAVIDYLAKHPSVMSVEEALYHLNLPTKAKGPKLLGDSKWQTNFMANFDRMSLSGFNHIMGELVTKMTPGQRAKMRQLIDEADAS
jgi:ParB family transcriptional regulator, chromosome partitioning protein